MAKLLIREMQAEGEERAEMTRERERPGESISLETRVTPVYRVRKREEDVGNAVAVIVAAVAVAVAVVAVVVDVAAICRYMYTFSPETHRLGPSFEVLVAARHCRRPRPPPRSSG